MGNYSNVEYFSIKQDREIINAGGFFCHACLDSKPAIEPSPDPRYCQVCYDFLTKEAEMLPENKRPKWIPKPQRALKACEPRLQEMKNIALEGDRQLGNPALWAVTIDWSWVARKT